MDPILLPALFRQLHNSEKLMGGEDLAPNLPRESQLLLGAPPPKSSKLLGSFPVVNCPESIKKDLSRQAWLNVSLFLCI